MAATISWKLIDAATGAAYTGGAVRVYGGRSVTSDTIPVSYSSYKSSGSFTFDRIKTSLGYSPGSATIFIDVESSGYDRNFTHMIVEKDDLVAGTSWVYVISENVSPTELKRHLQFSTTYQFTTATSASGSATVTVYLKRAATISFNANGGSGAPASVTGAVGSTIVLPAGIPTRSGQTFKGWSTVQGGSVVHQPGATIKLSSSQTLYAVWTSDTVSIAYNLNGAPGTAPASGTCVLEKTPCSITSTVPTFTGYVFGGWNARYNPGEVRYFGEATKLVAEWR